MWKYFVFGLLGVSPVFAADISTSTALLRGVDKVTGRMSTMQATIGMPITFGDLKITVDKCFTRPLEETPENSAYLTVVEKKGEDGVATVFNGWMFSSNPALSAMEHPVYDVWIISCVIPTSKKASIVVKEDDYPMPPVDEMQNDVPVDDDNPNLAEDDESATAQ